MTGHSDDAPGSAADSLDALSRAAAGGVSRRQLVRLGGALALGAVVPRWLVPKGAVEVADAAKRTGTCAAAKKGPCGGVRSPWAPACRHPVPNGKTSKFNGCGPQHGLDLPVLGHGDFVPDRPLGVVNFFDPCKGHDCCYGRCGSKKAECDKDFLDGMRKACLRSVSLTDLPPFGPLRMSTCFSLASTYYAAVSSTQTGMDAYNAGQQEVCDCCEAYTVRFSSTIVMTPDPGFTGGFRFTYTAEIPLTTPADGSAAANGSAPGAYTAAIGAIDGTDGDHMHWAPIGTTADAVRVVNFDAAVGGGAPTLVLQPGFPKETYRLTDDEVDETFPAPLWIWAFSAFHPGTFQGQPATFVLQPGTTTPNGGVHTVAQGVFDYGPVDLGAATAGPALDWGVTEHTEITIVADGA